MAMDTFTRLTPSTIDGRSVHEAPFLSEDLMTIYGCWRKCVIVTSAVTIGGPSRKNRKLRGKGKGGTRQNWGRLNRITIHYICMYVTIKKKLPI